MKRFLIVPLFIASLTPVFAVENTDLVDQVNTLQQQEYSVDDLKFHSFTSCEDMSKTLTDFVKENFVQPQPMPYRRGGPMPIDDMAIMEDASVAKSVGAPAPQVGGGDGGVASSSIDFSETNIQVAGVDEPEVLKSDGDHLYYYNQRLQKVFVLRSPLNRSTSIIAMNDARVVAVIAMPASFSQVQLFVRPGQLVVLGQRWSQNPVQGIIDNGSKTDIAVFDIRDASKPKLTKFSDLNGMYQDARLVGNKLYVVSQLGINRRWYPQQVKNVDDVVVDAEDMLPKVIDIAYTKDATAKNLTLGDKVYPYHVSVQKPDCSEVHYVLPTKDSIKQYGLNPQFTVVRAIDLDDGEKKIATTTAFGSSSTIHLTADALYLANYFWTPGGFGKCPAGMACIRGGGGEEKTLLHKFDLTESKISYVNSALIPGSPLNQWSMSEDAAGNFRILTSTWNPEQATHLITLDKAMGQLGSLLNIEPGEQFKAARFMDDKLYLVTFEQIDPLFVIELKDLKQPKILGELKIPGYSTYLHPYAPASNGVQRLLGIGYDTTTNQRGGTQNSGIKVDLYKVDYTKKDAKGDILITQEQTKTFGGKGSDSEALMNPRLFVWDAKKQLLVLPLVLQDAQMGKSCSTQYDPSGKVIGEQCRDNEIYTTTFAGMKALQVTPTAITEKASYDYISLLKQDTQTYGTRQNQIDPWQLVTLQFRVGYVGDVLYSINNLFAHFVIPGTTGQETYVALDETVKLK